MYSTFLYPFITADQLTIALRILLFYYNRKAYANKMYVFPIEKYTGTKFNR